MASQRLFLSLVVLGVLGCWSLSGHKTWEIHLIAEFSSSSKFYVLNDWQDTFTEDVSATPALPATAISDIMLKTLGILRDGARWAGVQMGSLFSRPHATALFVLDGATKGTFGSLSERKFSVDQTGLTGATSGDMQAMFAGDNVAVHMSKVFDGQCQTRSICANENAALAASAEGDFSGSAQFTDVVKMIRKDSSVLVPYGLETHSLDLEVDEEMAVLAELFMIHQTMDQLKELKSYVHDGAPDIYVFTISTMRALELKYGVGSDKVGVAAKLVESTIKQVTEELVDLYDGKILVQALVLEWTFPEEENHEKMMTVHTLLKPYLTTQNFEDFKANLPHVELTEAGGSSAYLCFNVKSVLGPSYKVVCPEMSWTGSSRYVRATEDQYYGYYGGGGYDDDPTANVTLGNVASARSESFAAIFLITLFLGLSLGLAVFAVSWMMWTMDPGRDSIIYRQIADPNEGMRM